MHFSRLDIRLDFPSLTFNKVSTVISDGSTARSPM